MSAALSSPVWRDTGLQDPWAPPQWRDSISTCGQQSDQGATYGLAPISLARMTPSFPPPGQSAGWNDCSRFVAPFGHPLHRTSGGGGRLRISRAVHGVAGGPWRAGRNFMQPGCGLRFRHLANQQADMIVRAVWPLWCTPWTVPLAGVGAGKSRGPCTGSLGAPGAPRLQYCQASSSTVRKSTDRSADETETSSACCRQNVL